MNLLEDRIMKLERKMAFLEASKSGTNPMGLGHTWFEGVPISPLGNFEHLVGKLWVIAGKLYCLAKNTDSNPISPSELCAHGDYAGQADRTLKKSVRRDDLFWMEVGEFK